MNKNLVTIFTMIVCILLTGCTQPAKPSAVQSTSAVPPASSAELQPTAVTFSAEKIPVYYDDDGSLDGTTALLFLLSHPQADIRGISVSYGEAYPRPYIQHLGRLLDSFGISNISLGYGQDAPLAGTNEFPEGLRESANNFWGFPIPNGDKTYSVQPAPDLMVSLINQSAEPVTLFISGPCTNLAQALRIDPGIKNNIKAVFIMGGAVKVPGNVTDFYPDNPNKVAEWNIFADPLAASEVFESGLEIYMIPLDATNQVLITDNDTRQWRQGGEIADFAADIYDNLLSSWGNRAAIWDVMTAVIMLDPELCDFKPLHMQVITAEGDHNGQTATTDGEPNIHACLQPKAEEIRQRLIDVFTFGSSGVRPTPEITSTPVAAASITPERQLLRDDFSGSLTQGWTWQNEKPELWSFTPDGWLQITGEDASLLADDVQSNLLCRPSPEDDFQITVHLSADPVQNFQQATLYLYQDGNNYIAINRGFCAPCLTGGKGVFMEYKLGGEWGSFNTGTQDTDIYLRLTRQGDVISGYYAFEPETWQRLGRVGGKSMQLSDVCIGVSNVDSSGINADLTGKFDYFEISRP